MPKCKPKPKVKGRKAYRSAKTGRWTSKRNVRRHPNATITHVY